ncbi:MAG: glycerol kinase GlpK [Cyanobacteria bacterium P01_F01_bin.3]
MASLILALDQGTTSSRAILFNKEGDICGVGQHEITQYYPQPGWVEHDAEEIWQMQLKALRDALAKANAEIHDIAAIGITNQRETTVLWNRQTGKPLSKAIVWQDRRTADFCKQLKEQGKESLFHEKTGLLLDPYFSGTKIKWLLDACEGTRDEAIAKDLCFGTIDSWLVWQLTRGKYHVTDASNASRTLLFNIHSGEWDDELLQELSIPLEMLPKVVDSSGEIARCEIDEVKGVPICGIAGDQQAALFGQCCFEPGMVKNTYGTGCFMLMQTGDKPKDSLNRLLTTVAWRLGGTLQYALEGSVFTAGAAVQWLRDGLGVIQQSVDVEALAGSVDDNGGVFVVPAFTGLGAPHWDAYARGGIHGLTRGSTAGHVARATLESIAYQSAELLQAMESDAGVKLQELRVDGGACRNDLMMQFQSDILNACVVRPQCVETTAMGAAFLAGLAVGFWDDQAHLAQKWKENKRFSPSMSSEQRDKLMIGWRKAVTRSLHWAE